MYQRVIPAAALLCAAFAPSQGEAAPAAAAAAAAAAGVGATAGVCSNLAADYEQINKGLALTYAEGVGDDSAPRETYRQIESGNYLSRASMVLTLMQAHHCSMPDYEPSDIRYMSSALTCATDRLKSPIGTETPSCKMETWEPMK